MENFEFHPPWEFLETLFMLISTNNVGVLFRINFASQIPMQQALYRQNNHNTIAIFDSLSIRLWEEEEKGRKEETCIGGE